jgi:isoquinoline 1-oxidoreductase subunit beta
VRIPVQLTVNGAGVDVDDRHAKTPLLWVLRDVLGMHGTKFGCGIGYCAACTVLIDGRNTRSCQTAAARAVGKSIVTVEGVSGPVVDAVRDAWYRGNVVQCGYCQPGQTLAAMSLLESNPAPDAAQIALWMNGNLCRCGTYPRIKDAINVAAATLASGSRPRALMARPEPETKPLSQEDLADPVKPYIQIKPDGTVLVFSSQLEMGQGAHTGLATIVAEELDADFDSIQVVNAANGATPSGDVYGNLVGGGFQITGGSNSTRAFWARYRQVAAQARARLIAAASESWGVPPSEVEIGSGVISHSSGKRATFADLAAVAESMPVPEGAQPKRLSDYTVIGREGRLRVDSAGKILGTTLFTIDVSLPSMLTAVVLHPPRFGGRVASVDDRAALAEPGVKAVIPIEEGVAVVAEAFADAQRGLLALNVEWNDEHAEQRSSEELLREHRRLVESGERAVIARAEGDVDDAFSRATHAVDAIYELPYLAHAPMEPNNAVCRMNDDGVLEVWAGTESPVYTQMTGARIASIEQDRVRVHVPDAGGSFGLHYSSGANDPAAEALQIAKALEWQYPVKVQASREEEFKSGRYRAMAVHRVRAGVDSNGRISAYHHLMAAAPTSPNLPFVGDFLFREGVDFMTVTGVVDNPYTFENFKVEATNVDAGVPIMVWRSVGNSHTEFARESALDELAIAAGRDPIEFRRGILANNPRTLRALDLAAERSGWGSSLPEGRALGIACTNYLSHSAQVVEVSMDNRGRVHVERIVFALDSGIILNPHLVRAQVEGGALWGLGAAAWGEVVLGNGGNIVTENFDRYPVMRMQSTPAIEVHLIESTEEPSGVGEVSVPTVAPALANAIFALTGTRIRRLPMSRTIQIY